MEWTTELENDLTKREEKDLCIIPQTSTKRLGSNLIDPTLEESLEMVSLFREGKVSQEVQRLVKRGKLTFSIEQVQEAYQIWQKVISNKSSRLVLEEEKVEGKVEEFVR